MDPRQRRRELGGMIIGGLLLLAGGYYFLRNTLGIDLDVEWDMIWPIAVIAIGTVIVIGTFTRSRSGEHRF